MINDEFIPQTEEQKPSNEDVILHEDENPRQPLTPLPAPEVDLAKEQAARRFAVMRVIDAMDTLTQSNRVSVIRAAMAFYDLQSEDLK